MLEHATAFFERHLWESRAGEPVRAYLDGRGIGDATAKEFRLGLSPGRGLAQKARERGFTADELKAAGLVNARGNDYFPPRLMFPLADARGRVVGFQARKLHDDDPLRGKYVNSPEGELFHKSAILYGLHLARQAIAKQDRALVVEGNTDVIALRQSGLEPVVASMGTALTERQLRELGRLTRRLFLCFDADAAGEDATLRGMELAAGAGLRRPGRHAAEGAGSRRRARAVRGAPGRRRELRPLPRSARGRARARPAGGVRAGARGARAGPRTRPSGRRRCGCSPTGSTFPRETLGGIAPARGGVAPPDAPRRLLDAGVRLERDALAACVAHPELRKLLGELTPEHFDAEAHRRFRPRCSDGGGDEDELVALRAELDAVAAKEGLDERSGTELILRLRERKLRRDLEAVAGDLERVRELQVQLARVRHALDGWPELAE